MSETSAKTVDEWSCADARSCCTSEWKFDNCSERIKILEANKEKVGFAMNLVNTKLDSQNQLLQQILFLQQNFCTDNSQKKDNNVSEIQQFVIQQLEEKINSLVGKMTEQSKLHAQQMGEFKEIMNEKLNQQSEVYNQQIKNFEEKISKNNLENSKEISSLQEKLLEKIKEKASVEIDSQKLKEIKEEIKQLTNDNNQEFNEIRRIILDQSESIFNKFNLKQKYDIDELNEKITSNDNDINYIQTTIKEHSDRMIFLQSQVDVLQKHRDLFGRVDEVERSVFDINDKLSDLSNDLIQLKKENWDRMSYIKFGNRWGYIADSFGASEKLIIKNNAYTSDVGTVNIKDQMIEYIPSEKGKNSNNMVRVYGQFKFSKASAEPTCNSLYYFEVKFNMVKKHQPQKSEMATIGVDSVPAIVTFVSSMMPENYTKCIYICCSKYGKIRYAGKAWSDGDICGCGVVFPPVGISGKQPYVFFTKNGKLFEKAIALEDPIDLFRPFIGVHSCTVETNFGENLDKKPFMYDVTKHVTPKTFFKETEFASAN